VDKIDVEVLPNDEIESHATRHVHQLRSQVRVLARAEKLSQAGTFSFH
jgi:hypothetical protein